MNVLVLAAHPDDEVLGCGGTIARSAVEGNQVHIAILGEGITSRYDRPADADPSLVEGLQAASRKAGQVLGAHEVLFLGLPDNRFDTVPLLDIIKRIESLIERIKPTVVYTQHGGDLNIDHSLLYRATLTATRPLTGTFVKEVFAYPVASSTEWAFQRFEPAFRANAFVDISRTLEQKIQAMAVYESEARSFPHPRSPEALRALALQWGSVAGLPACEPFELVRSIQR
jgi:LmbE family N-acetylglucosaminyl deacetylase